MLIVNAYRINVAPVVAEIVVGPGSARELEKPIERTVVLGTTRSDSTRGSA